MKLELVDVIFDDVVLGDSIVLAWEHLSTALRFELDVCLMPTHPEAVSPLQGERACFLKGALEFPVPAKVTGLLPMRLVKACNSPEETVDFETIHILKFNGVDGYYFEGEFGEVNIVSRPPMLILSESGRSVTGKLDSST